jgi:sugar lactone lactonase YvrE
VEAERGSLEGASAVAVSPDGRLVLVTDPNRGALAAFERDVLAGQITFVAARRDGEDGIDGLAGAAGVALSPDGAHVYVAGHGDRAVAVFAVAGAPCTGDCNDDAHVGIDELVRGVSIALERLGVAACPLLDRDESGEVTIDELVGAVENALEGCRG